MGSVTRRDFMTAVAATATASLPAYADDDHRPVEFWRHAFFDFNQRMGICGFDKAGARYAAAFEIPHDPAEFAAKLTKAKGLVCQRLAEGKGRKDDGVMEGNEEWLD